MGINLVFVCLIQSSTPKKYKLHLEEELKYKIKLRQ